MDRMTTRGRGRTALAHVGSRAIWNQVLAMCALCEVHLSEECVNMRTMGHTWGGNRTGLEGTGQGQEGTGWEGRGQDGTGVPRGLNAPERPS